MGRQLAFAVLSLLLVALVAPIVHVYAQEGTTLELTADQPFYYLKGEPMTINATGNASVPVTLSVYWNWRTLNDNELVYQNTKTLNASWTLPTAAQKPGFYRIEANTTETTVTIWRTLIHASSYQVAALPFSHEWQGINYTLQGRTFRAETQDDFIEIMYPKIPFLHNTRFYFNNMTFLVRLDGDGWAVDVIYMTIHAGLKWRINGTLDNPMSFEFECAHNPLRTWKQRLDRFQSENFLVFDWEDLRKAGKAFTWNATSKTLSVTIPASFDLDPYIFEDGFESGDFTAWTGTVKEAGATLEVVDTLPHHGTYHCHHATGTGDVWTTVYKDISAAVTCYMRLYVRFVNIPASNSHHLQLMKLRDNVYSLNVVYVGIYRDSGGDIHWFCRYYDDGAYPIMNTATPTVSEDTWYCVEAKFYGNGGAGETRVFLDGTERMTATGLTNDYSVYRIVCGQRDYLDLGGEYGATWLGASDKSEWYSDCVVVDSSYIGPEAEEGQDLTFTLAQNITALSSLARTIELQQFLIANPAMLSSLAMNKERPVTLTETSSFSSSLAKGVEVERLFTGAVTLFSSLSTTFELAVLDLYFTLTETVHPLASTRIGKEITRIFPGRIEILHSLGTATEGIALELTVILFETARTSAYAAATIVSVLTVEMVYAVAALGLVLALVGIGLVVLKRD